MTGVRTIDGPLCLANGIATDGDRKRSIEGTNRASSSFSNRESIDFSRDRCYASESSLYMVGPSPSGRRPVNGRDSLFGDGI